MTKLTLGHALDFRNLYEREGLERIDALFTDELKASGTALFESLMAARAAPEDIEYKDEAALIIALAPHLEDFIAGLFGIQSEITALIGKRNELAPLYACKRQLVQKQAKARETPAEDAGAALVPALEKGFGEPFSELVFARHVMNWFEDKDAHADLLEKAASYAAWALHTEAGQASHGKGVLFRQPARTDPMHLVNVDTVEIEGVLMMQVAKEKLHQRDGFKFIDSSSGLKGVLDQATYCIWCHKQGRDSCSKGLRDKAANTFRENFFGDEMAGCPLEEKISEMNWLMSEGHVLGALAAACVNNPMLAGTGHRICNDCVKACVYQKQEPVDIPQIETQSLKEVLALPWGFEIYSLLTRWNPLNIKRPLPRPETGFKVLVVGMGPAGYTLSHHLMNDGHHIVAVDGLKIEPLPADVSGVAPDGTRTPFAPVRDIGELFEPLETRVMAGFGGVAEYGITARWNKNYLKVIRLLLERRSQFAMSGGVRFGGTITIDDAFGMGFDHIALCMGAGKPTILDVPNGLARGVRQASDFLMSLQLTGTAKTDSIVNLQLRLPVVVIGGGLTAIDAATESLAYYPVQVEKFLSRYEALMAESGEMAVRTGWTEEEAAIADEFMAHAKVIRHERGQAEAEGRQPDITGLIRKWGGVTIAYRRRMVDSPSYTLNHEEIGMGIAEGIRFAELLSPTAIDVDAWGHAACIQFARCKVSDEGKVAPTEEKIYLPARSILVAAGTRPNVTLAGEDPSGLQLDGRYFQAVDAAGKPVKPGWSAKPEQAYMLTHVRDDGRAISFYGDMHPSFAGNVVRAMASARHGSAMIGRMFEDQTPSDVDAASLQGRLNDEFCACVKSLKHLTPNTIEIVVRAPAAARNFQPGQFFRLQNYETKAKHVNGTTLTMEGLAVAGARVEPDSGLISLVVRERGGSSSLCQLFTPGEPIVLMGPTGAPAEIVADENVLLIGGGVGNVMLLSIAQAFKQAGSKVLRFAAYEKADDRCKEGDIESTADSVVWCWDDESRGLEPGREQDMAFTGNVVAALEAYGRGELGDASIPLQGIDRIIVAGSPSLMAAVAKARHSTLAGVLKPGHIALGCINSPMQCMMKKICAQCLQPQHDPETGEQRVVYSCSNQYQPLDCVDFSALMQRQRQQSVQEKLTGQWVRHCIVQQ